MLKDVVPKDQSECHYISLAANIGVEGIVWSLAVHSVKQGLKVDEMTSEAFQTFNESPDSRQGCFPGVTAMKSHHWH